MTLLDLCKLLKRSLWLVIGLPVLCALVCGVVVAMAPPEYTTSATITASAEPAGVGAFATAAAADQTKNGITVTAATNNSTRVITITAKGGNADACITAANRALNTTFIKAFSRYNVSNDLVNITVNMQLKRATAAIDESPSVAKSAGIAFAAGLFAAICIVVIVDLARGRIHSARDIEQDYEVRLLGRIPLPGKQESRLSREQLFANVRFACGEHRSLCVVPISDGALSAQTCMELAEAAQQANKRALVIDADMNGTSKLGEELAAAHGLSLADILSDDIQLDDATVQTQGISYIPAGASEQSTSALLDSARLAQIIEQAQLEYDLVLINAAPSDARTDFSFIAHATGSTLFCVQEFETKRADIENAAIQLSIAKANVIGFVAAA